MSQDQTGHKSNPLDNPVSRRQLLKRLGFGSLTVAGSGSLVALLQACSSAATPRDQASFLTESELATLATICEGILPRTQTPGAIDAGVAEHLNEALTISYRRREADYFRRGMSRFVANNEGAGVSLAAMDTTRMTSLINDYLRRYDSGSAMLEDLDERLEQGGALADDELEAYFVTNVIDATVWSYFSSELIGETVLRHDPVPGSYDACIEYRAGEHSWSS